MHLVDIVVNVCDTIEEALVLLHSQRYALLTWLFVTIPVKVVLTNVYHKQVALRPDANLHLFVAAKIVDYFWRSFVSNSLRAERILVLGHLLSRPATIARVVRGERIAE